MAPLQITALTAERSALALPDLPWDAPLSRWPAETLAALPRGISRHVVRFVRLADAVVAVKENTEELVKREYGLLRVLRRLDVPCVVPVAVVTGRTSPEGEPLDPALVTQHLQFSLPYRALFSQSLRPDTATRLVDALAVLLVRLHLAGFYWGDVSLSNTLFRRDAGEFAAYLVDAETGELHNELSDGQRENDVEVARINIAGELMDLEAAEYLDEGVDPVEVANSIVERYHSLWQELTGQESFEQGERWRVQARIERLNELGFDVGELAISTDVGGAMVQIQPKVVDAGHHSRRLLRLTGIDAENNQARRLLNDLDSYVAATDRQNDDEEIAAHDWLAQVFDPVVRAIPRRMRRKLEPAEVFHEVLEHRWYRSEQAGRDIPLLEAARSYVDEVLSQRPDEQAVILQTGLMDTGQMAAVGMDRDEAPLLGAAGPDDPDDPESDRIDGWLSSHG